MRRGPIPLATGTFLALLLLAMTDAGAAEKRPALQITDNIICPCSCGEVLSGCICETGIEMKAFVDNSLAGGKTKEQITAALVTQYGEVVLGAPKARGFNLIVWVAPFLATIVGFIIAFSILRRWAGRKQAPAPAGGEAGPEAGLDALRQRAEDEIRRLRG